MVARKLFTLSFFALVLCLNASSQQLVLPGDHADPSVVKIGNSYWASATTSNWFPAFPLMESKDLIHWKQHGYVFTKMPEWADYYFWAPEISYEKGKVYVYYAAHKKNGNLCVGVASADKPEGPYTDHGPLICQPDGSIDAFPMRDENGKLYLIWKEDANSIGKPTPIWAQPMNEERTALTGEKKELFRNDKQWEGNLVEGVSMIRQNGYFYAFYAAAGCCGVGCTYKIGVARAKNLLGPWEKYNNNPVMTNTQQWICLGHGTPVEKNGHFYFLHHAYDKKSNTFTGRQGILTEFKFTPDNWVTFIRTNRKSITKSFTLTDHFKGNRLSDQWQWSVFENICYKIDDGLQLYATPELSGTFIGQKITTGNFTATAEVENNKSTASAGLAAIGDEKNSLIVFVKGTKIHGVGYKDGKEINLFERTIATTKNIYLRMEVRNVKSIYFSFSVDGKKFTTLNENPIDDRFLPPWDRAVRVGLVSKGTSQQKAFFKIFRLISR